MAAKSQPSKQTLDRENANRVHIHDDGTEDGTIGNYTDLMEVDELDSTYDSVDFSSDTTSVMSAAYRGIVENGRRYQTLKEDNPYFMPSDDLQFETIELAHMIYTVMDAQEDNPHFRSPIRSDAEHILDIGTGDGSWALDVADQPRWEHTTVWGVDLFPSPKTQMTPNCVLEIDDITKEWTWPVKFDLIHMRLLLGAFTSPQWDTLYATAYENLQPGGWIEQVEVDIVDHIRCDDGTMPKDCALATFGDLLNACSKRAGTPLDVCRSMRSRIQAAGFINIHEKGYKVPIGPWVKHPIHKDAGKMALRSFKTGMEGWALFFLTKYGDPNWTLDEVDVYMAKLRKELDMGWHIYWSPKRVWAQKPPLPAA